MRRGTGEPLSCLLLLLLLPGPMQLICKEAEGEELHLQAGQGRRRAELDCSAQNDCAKGLGNDPAGAPTAIQHPPTTQAGSHRSLLSS